MDPISTLKELVELAFTVHSLIGIDKENRKTAKDLYGSLLELEKRMLSYRNAGGEAIEDSAVKDILDLVDRDVEKVKSQLEDIRTQFCTTRRMFVLKKVQLLINAQELGESLNGMLTSITDINCRLESCGLSIHQVNLLKLTLEKLDRLAETLENKMITSEDFDTKKHQRVMSDCVETLKAKKNDDANSHRLDAGDIHAGSSSDQRSDETFMSSIVDANEELELNLLSQLPSAAKYFMAKITKSGTDAGSSIQLLDEITEFWTGWQIERRDISFIKDEFEEQIEIGRGTSAVVYDGLLKVHSGSRLRVAVKSIMFDEESISDVLREVFLNLMLQHHAVVDLHGMFYPDKKRGKALIVVERLACSLADAVKSGKPFNATNVLRDIAAGLAHMHDHGVIHRDIKPGNILLTDDGMNAKLSDFGSSRRQVENTLTLQSTAVGTVTYMPPEVEPHSISKTHRSWDTWSFGIVMCEVLRSDGLSEYRLKRARQIDALPSARNWAMGIENGHLREIALWCLRGSPKERAPMKKVYLHLNGTLPIDEVPSKPRFRQTQEPADPSQNSTQQANTRVMRATSVSITQAERASDTHFTGARVAKRPAGSTASSKRVAQDPTTTTSMPSKTKTQMHPNVRGAGAKSTHVDKMEVVAEGKKPPVSARAEGKGGVSGEDVSGAVEVVGSATTKMVGGVHSADISTLHNVHGSASALDTASFAPSAFTLPVTVRNAADMAVKVVTQEISALHEMGQDVPKIRGVSTSGDVDANVTPNAAGTSDPRDEKPVAVAEDQKQLWGAQKERTGGVGSTDVRNAGMAVEVHKTTTGAGQRSAYTGGAGGVAVLHRDAQLVEGRAWECFREVTNAFDSETVDVLVRTVGRLAICVYKVVGKGHLQKLLDVGPGEERSIGKTVEEGGVTMVLKEKWSELVRAVVGVRFSSRKRIVMTNNSLSIEGTFDWNVSVREDVQWPVASVSSGRPVKLAIRNGVWAGLSVNKLDGGGREEPFVEKIEHKSEWTGRTDAGSVLVIRLAEVFFSASFVPDVPLFTMKL